MANRYWVGGTGNWSDTARWSSTSGGSGGASVPTSADDVFFDNNSAAGTFTVTIDTASAVCGAFDASGITNAARKMTLTGTASVGLLSVNGNWTNPATSFFGWTTWTGATVTFVATGTITTNAVSFVSILGINGSGITVTLGGAFTSTGSLNISTGTFDTSASNYALTLTGIVLAANSNTRSLNLNGSSVALSAAAPYTDSSTGGFTLNAGTSTITCSNASPTFAGNGKTFYNVTFSSTAIVTLTLSGATTVTYNNFTVAAKSGAVQSNILCTSGSAIQVNGTLTVNSGASATPDRRYRWQSGTIGGQVTINAAAVSLTNVDFRDVTGAGAASPFTGTSLGDGQNNSGITFTPAKTVYWSSASGASANWNSASWATGSGGAGSVANFPIAQDTIIIDDAGLTAGNTITINANYWIGAISSTRTAAWTLAYTTTTPTFFKDFTVDANATITGTSNLAFNAKSGNVQTITTNGVSFPAGASVTGSTFRINGNLTVSSASTFTLTSGTLDLTNNGAGNYTLSTGAFNSNNSNTRAITFGTGSIDLTAIPTTANIIIWNCTTSTGLTVSGTPNVYLSGNATSATWARQIGAGHTAGGSSANACNFIITAGSDAVNTFTTGHVNTIDYSNGGTSTYSGSSPTGAVNIYGNVICKTGMTFTSLGVNFIATSGTQQFTSAGLTIDSPVTQNNPGATLQLQDNLTMGSSRTFTHTGGTLDLNSKTATINTFSSTGTGTRAIAFNGGTLSISGTTTSAFTASGSNLTSAGVSNGIIDMTAATAKTFAGGGFPYTARLNQGGAGLLTVTGNNSFAGLSNTVQPATITFPAGSVTTFTGAATLAGTAGNLITLNSSTPGTQFTFTFPTSPTVSSLSFTSVSDCIGYENSYWQALQSNGCVNNGNNLGWLFTSTASIGGMIFFS